MPKRSYRASSFKPRRNITFEGGGVRVRHRDYIGDISSSIAFTNTSYNFNPGLYATFPWLCNIASNFQEYYVRGAEVQFISTSADALNSTNTALGTVIVVADYNASNPQFNTKQQMENSMLGISGKPSYNLKMPIDVRQKHTPLNRLYVRTTAVPTGNDQRLYDFCNFQLATVGSQAAAVVGELWIAYDITFYKPILTNVESPPRVLYAHYTNSAYTNAHPLNGSTGSATLVKVDDNIGLSINDTTITFPIGSIDVPMLVQITWTGTSASCTLPTETLTNMTAYNIINNSTTHNNAAAGVTASMVQFYSWLTASDNTISSLALSAATLPSAGSWVDIIVMGVSLGDN